MAGGLLFTVTVDYALKHSKNRIGIALICPAPGKLEGISKGDSVMRRWLVLSIVLLAGCRGTDENYLSEADQYHVYWLTKDGEEVSSGYIPLLLSRRPIEELSLVDNLVTEPLLDATAVMVITYAKDSIWNDNGHPFKPISSAGTVDSAARLAVLNGKTYPYSNASIAEVVSLLEHPLGTISIHRTHAPINGAEEFVSALLDKLRRQMPSAS